MQQESSLWLLFVQILDPDLDLRTVKHSVWKSGGDMKLYFKENKEGSKDRQELSADSASRPEEAATTSNTPPEEPEPKEE